MIDRFLPKVRSWVDTTFLEELRIFDWQASLEDSARHVLVGGGKALRPACLIWAYSELSNHPIGVRPPRHVLQWALALEMIHTYSLVHDDLPAMDDDSFRRGRPTLHVLKTEAEAVLTGDALLTGAFELIARSDLNEGRAKSSAVRELAIAAGGRGMIAGQIRDMQAEKLRLESVEQLQNIHNEKTGALFGAAFALGALAVEGSVATNLSHLREWGVQLGLLFQIVDDVLDVSSTRQDLGKSVGKDIASEKLTYVSAYGIAGARGAGQKLADKLIADSGVWTHSRESVRSLVEFVLQRKS